MKKIIIGLMLVATLFGVAAATVWSPQLELEGKQMVPTGGPWLTDDAIMYLGTGKDVSLVYTDLTDLFEIKDTDLAVEEDATVGGDLAVTGAISAGAGTISAGVYDGNFRLAADHGFYSTAGAGFFDFTNGTGVFRTPTGAHTINGAVTFAANKGIAMTSGTGAMDFSLGSGIFKTTTGAVTIGPGLATVSGGLAYSVNATTTLSTTLTSANTKVVYGIDASGGHVTLTLPDPTTVTGRVYMIATAKDMSTNNIIVADTGAGKIGGETGADTLTSTDAAAALTVVSDGTHYLVTNKVGTWT